MGKMDVVGKEKGSPHERSLPLAFLLCLTLRAQWRAGFVRRSEHVEGHAVGRECPYLLC